jgi:hypothetical protein
MKTDIKNCPSEADIETAFEKIHEHRRAIVVITKPYDEQIRHIDDKVDAMIESLMEDRTTIVRASSDAIHEHDEAIDALVDEIQTIVLANGKTCSTEYGTCTHVKGRKASVKWDDAALMGYVAASPENETILQFRSEGKEGAPSTRFKLVELED